MTFYAHFFVILSIHSVCSFLSPRTYGIKTTFHRDKHSISPHPSVHDYNAPKKLLRAANDGELMIDAALNGRVLDVRKLLDGGADPDTKDEYDCTALLHACFFGHEDIVRLLLERKADVNAETKQGNTALRIACDNGRDAVAQVLIDHKADINVRNEYGETALHEASSRGRDDMVRFLLANNADSDIRNQNGETALHKACVSGALDCVALLLDHNASYTAMNIWGESPVEIANAGATENPSNRNFFQIFHMLSNYVKTKETEKQEKLLDRLAKLEAKTNTNVTAQVESIIDSHMKSITTNLQRIVDENNAIKNDASISIEQSRSNTQALNEDKQANEKKHAEVTDRLSKLEGKIGSGMVGLVTSVVQAEQKPISDQMQKIVNENKSLMDRTTSALQELKSLDVASNQNKITNIERVMNQKIEQDKTMFSTIRENIDKISTKTNEDANVSKTKINNLESLLGEVSKKETVRGNELTERLHALEGKLLNDANFNSQKMGMLETKVDSLGQSNVGGIEKKLEVKNAEDTLKMNDLNQRLRSLEEKGMNDLNAQKHKVSTIEQNIEQKKQQDTEVFAGIVSRILSLEEKMTNLNNVTTEQTRGNVLNPSPTGPTFTDRIVRVATHLGINLARDRPVLDQIASIEQVVYGQQREGLLVARVTSLEEHLGIKSN